MMKPTLAPKFLWEATSGHKGAASVVLSCKGGVDSVHTYVCFMEVPRWFAPGPFDVLALNAGAGSELRSCVGDCPRVLLTAGPSERMLVKGF